jgi:hypothetical protein
MEPDLPPKLAVELAARATEYWRRIAAVMRALYGPDWPKEYAEGEVVLGWTRSGRPFWKVGAASYTLEDEAYTASDEHVVEVIETRLRIIGAGGVVLRETTTTNAEHADLN